MKIYHADKTALKLLQICISIITAVLLLVTVLLVLYLRYVLHIVFHHAEILFLLSVLYLASAIFMNLLVLPLYFRNLCCMVTPSQIAVRRGIFLRHEQSIQIQSIQFVQTITGLHGRYGMHFLTLYVYGGSLSILFLSRQDYQEFTEFLERKGVFYAP